MEPSLSPTQPPTGSRHWRGREHRLCQLDAWPGPRCLFGSVFSQHLSPLEPSLHAYNHLFIFSPPFGLSFSLWKDKGHKYMENHHAMSWHDNDEAWMAVQTVQGHIRSLVHFLGILDKILKIIWFPPSHPHSPDAKTLFVSWGLIIATIYKDRLEPDSFLTWSLILQRKKKKPCKTGVTSFQTQGNRHSENSRY